MRRFMSREVERVATRKSLVFILRIAEKPGTLYELRTICWGRGAVKSFFCLIRSFSLARFDDNLGDGLTNASECLSDSRTGVAAVRNTAFGWTKRTFE